MLHSAMRGIEHRLHPLYRTPPRDFIPTSDPRTMSGQGDGRVRLRNSFSCSRASRDQGGRQRRGGGGEGITFLETVSSRRPAHSAPRADSSSSRKMCRALSCDGSSMDFSRPSCEQATGLTIGGVRISASHCNRQTPSACPSSRSDLRGSRHFHSRHGAEKPALPAQNERAYVSSKRT